MNWFAVLGMSIALTGGPQWSPPVQISTGDRALAPELAMNRFGDAIAVWDQEVGAECATAPASLSCVHVVTLAERPSPDGAWRQPVELNRPGVDSRPRPAIDSKGNAAVIWVHDIGIDRVLQATYRHGPDATWPEPNDLSDYVLSVASHEVSVGDGDARVVWRERTESGSFARYQIRPARSGVWNGPQVLSSTAVDGPSLAFASVAWAEETAVIEAGIETYGTHPTSIPAAEATTPLGPVTTSSRAVVFVARSNGRVVVEGSLWDVRAGWPPASVLGEARDTASASPRAAGTVAVWIGPTGVRAAEGSTADGLWSNATTLARDDGATDPVVATDEQGNAVAAWLDGSGVVEAALRPRGTRAWSSRVRLSSAGASHPRVAMALAGAAVVIWERTDGNRVVVEAAALSPTGPVLDTIEIPKRGRIGRRLSFYARSAAWGARLAGFPVWRFGDGTSETGNRTMHVYRHAGTYRVTVTQADAAGGTASATRTIVIRRR